MNKKNNIILDFSHIYPADIERQVKGLKQVILTGPEQKTIDEIPEELQKN